ncbi:hypothetical protein PoB_004219300 [Plakobranchus ocellatus]|uniref:Uncharacterized protein n=1 Tax=Plakobranchus ocellatus TaxID=259542 RepID=A0AAV4BA41_9GAST|nr:hypothetical protein PoB_004219300 [Plakobranchus ocellatus]
MEGQCGRGKQKISCIETHKSWAIGKGYNNFVRLSENRSTPIVQLGPYFQWLKNALLGEIPGLCFASNLTEGVKYVVFLKLETGDTAYRQDYPAIVAERAVIQEMPDYCEVIPSYPKGVDSTNAKVKCPPPRSDPDECIEPPTDAPPELESPPPPPPPGHGKPETEITSATPADEPGAKSPAAGPGNPKPGNTEASYEPVVEGDSDGNSDDGGKDAANILAWNWTLALAVLSSLLCL